VRPFLGVPSTLGPLALRLESPGIACPLFSLCTEVPVAWLIPSLEIWVGPGSVEEGESEPGVVPTVVAGMDGGLGQVHGGGEEGGAATLSDQGQDEEGIEAGLPQPLVPQEMSGVGKRRFALDPILDSRGIANGVRVSGSSATSPGPL